MRRTGAFLLAGILGCALHAQIVTPIARLPVPGIDGAEVRCMVQDGFGALWIGTDRGLHRFDGVLTEHYLNDPLDPSSINDDAVFDLVLGHDSAIWVGTFGGVWRIDPLTGRRGRVLFEHREGGTGDQECVALAVASDGLWAFGNKWGLSFLHHGDSLFRPAGPPDARAVMGGVVADDGTLWFTDRRTLVHFDPRSGALERFPFTREGADVPPKTLLLRVVRDEHDPAKLWCTSWGLGLLRFDLARRVFDGQWVVQRALSDLHNIVRSALPVDGRTWLLAMDGDLVEVDTFTDRVRTVRGEEVPPMASIASVHHLSNGTILIGGSGEVDVLRPIRPPWEELTRDVRDKSTWITPSALDDGYWLVRFYADRALMHVDTNGRTTFSATLPEAEVPYEAFKVLQARDGRVWLATTRGLLMHVPGSGEMAWSAVEPDGMGNIHPLVHGVHEDKQGALWAAGDRHGLLRWSPAKERWDRVGPPVGHEFPKVDVISVSDFDEERLLVGFGANGAALFAPRTGAYEVVQGPMLNKAHFRTTMQVLADGQGRILVLTRSHGILRLERVPGGGWSIGRRWLPLERPSFHAAVVDGRGRFWIESSAGGYLLDPATDILHRLDPLHGVPVRSPMGVAAGHAGDVLVHVGRWARMNRDLDPGPADGRLMVRAMRAGQQQVDVLELLTGKAQLPRRDNDLRVVFGVVSLFEGDAFTYAYRLVRDGGEGVWNDLGRQRMLDLVDMRPGAYRLELRAVGPVPEPLTAIITFAILPPWWGTLWGRGLLLLLAVGIVIWTTRLILLARYRRQVRELERERELEKVRMRIARDIHDGIGSGLTRINILARQLGAQAGPQAERIEAASAELVKELGEIVWTVDPRNDDYGSFLAYVRSTLGRQAEHLPMALTSDLRCAAEDNTRSIGPEVKRNILLVLKEAVNNAVKHSKARHIEVSLDLGHDEARLIVRDDGTGFDPTAVREGANGLINFRRRAEELGGSVEVRTGATGTTVEMRVPIVHVGATGIGN
ncbi:MAG: ATP-binding protein [Flavobacteriales bacterium]|nr:ATP-binding protein [Flavobacteriales bacterium]